MLRAQRWDRPFATVADALGYFGYVQIDPVNICGRMHDLILRNRVTGYTEGGLMTLLHGGSRERHQDSAGKEKESDAIARPAPRPAAERVAFEHHHPERNILAAFPLEAWPHLIAAMRIRSRTTSAWSGRLTPRERRLAPDLLAEITARGPLGSEDFDDDRRAHRVVWGTASLVKSTLQKLFFHGRLLIAQRSNHRRRYDLPERVLPAGTLVLREPDANETARWVALLRLRQLRLATLKRVEASRIEDAIRPIVVEGCPPLYCLEKDVPELELAAVESAPSAPVRLLAPLDPLIYDRRVTSTLWNFEYTWEAYVPPAKRVRGHYALPVLAGTELVGHVEPRAERNAGRLIVVSHSVRRGCSTAEAVRQLATWLGLRKR